MFLFKQVVFSPNFNSPQFQTIWWVLPIENTLHPPPLNEIKHWNSISGEFVIIVFCFSLQIKTNLLLFCFPPLTHVNVLSFSTVFNSNYKEDKKINHKNQIGFKFDKIFNDKWESRKQFQRKFQLAQQFCSLL